MRGREGGPEHRLPSVIYEPRNFSRQFNSPPTIAEFVARIESFGKSKFVWPVPSRERSAREERGSDRGSERERERKDKRKVEKQNIHEYAGKF